MNAKPEVIELEGEPRLFFRATRNIPIGEEVLYDYGDRDPVSLREHPWLRFQKRERKEKKVVMLTTDDVHHDDDSTNERVA